MSSNFATYSDYLASLKGKSWAEICWEEEEREEEEAKLALELALKIIDLERKVLYDKGKYEPEEGEIFE